MNRKEDRFGDTALFERLRKLECRIEELEAKLTNEKNLFLEEDLKARGMK